MGYEQNEKIEKFVQKNMKLKNYSYHQLEIFIKLYINQFSTIEGKMDFSDPEQKKNLKNILIISVQLRHYLQMVDFQNH